MSDQEQDTVKPSKKSAVTDENAVTTAASETDATPLPPGTPIEGEIYDMGNQPGGRYISLGGGKLQRVSE